MPPAPQKPHKAISDPAEINQILEKGQVLYLGLCDQGQPYVLPFNYGVAGDRVYLHTGLEGYKFAVLAANDRVSFAVAVQVELLPGEVACAWECRYKSVVAFGRATPVEDPEEIALGLTAITRHYAGPGDYDFKPESLARARVIRIQVEEITGKRNFIEPGQ